MIIVSGLPRSGTSLMMNILSRNGIKVYSDEKREADKHNPKGYFEVKNIGKKLGEDPHFLEGKEGCVKVVSPFLEKIKGNHKIIFMERNLEEIFQSMEKMSRKIDKEEKGAFKKHLKSVKKGLENKKAITINFNKLIKNPVSELKKLKNFLPEINIEKSKQAIDKDLYRNRK